MILPWLCLGQPATEHLRFLLPPPPPVAMLALPAVPNVLTLMLSMFMWWFMSAMVAAAMAIAPPPIPAAAPAAAAEAAAAGALPWPYRLKCAAHMPLHRLPCDCLPHPATRHRGRDCCWAPGRLPLPAVETEAWSVPAAVAAEYSAEAEYERPSRRSCRSTSLSSLSPAPLVAAAAAAFFLFCLLWLRPAPPGTSSPG